MYPLTEDLRPGDVFLVTRTIEEDQDIFREKGFLPLDLNLARLDLNGALKAASAFQHPIGNALDGAIWPPFKDARLSMSRAAFPSYSVSVDRQTGLQLAIPIEAVPVALSAMRAEKGMATVTLSGAYTYGLDAATVRASLVAWFDDAEHRKLVAPIADGMAGDGPLWLRIVSRVYLVQRVTVDVATEEALGADIGAGAAPASTPVDPAADVARRVADAIGNAAAIPGAPGGRLQVVAAGQRAVTLDEEFERPLVVGYAGFQVAIDRNGRLLSGIASTLTVLESGDLPSVYGIDESSTRIDVWLQQDAGRKDALHEYLAGLSGLSSDTGTTQLLFLDEYAGVRRAVIDHFEIP